MIIKMAAAAMVAIKHHGTFSSRTGDDESRDRRQTAREDRDNFWRSLEEQAHFRDMMVAFDADRSGDLDANELRNLIQKYGQGIYVDADGNQLDFMHSGAGKHQPSSPTDEEIAWILAASAKVKKNRIVASELKFALVCEATHISTFVLRIQKVFVKSCHFKIICAGDLEQL